MLKEKYFNYKLDYRNYILLIKNGNFYLSIDNDAIIMNKLFNYKIKELTNLIKVGFPITSLSKVLEKLEKEQVNYLVIEDNNIVEKEKFKNNNYSLYFTDYNNYSFSLSRINKISEILKNKIKDENINQILSNIENIICKTDY